MNVLNLEHISKVYGDKVIFDDISCGIHQGDKIGIIGINGTGKTTFLRILAGLEEADDGQVIMQNGLRISFLSQHPTFPEGATILSYVTQGQREQSWNPETEAHMVLNKLGIEDHEEEIAHLSGGQKKRVALAAVLVNPTDVLILDEPTNDLDIQTLTILEDYLDTFAGIVINPGDIIVGDSDGLLAIKPDEHTAELAEIARNYHAGEEKQLEGILTRGEWPRPWVDEALKKVGFEFVD